MFTPSLEIWLPMQLSLQTLRLEVIPKELIETLQSPLLLVFPPPGHLLQLVSIRPADSATATNPKTKNFFIRSSFAGFPAVFFSIHTNTATGSNLPVFMDKCSCFAP